MSKGTHGWPVAAARRRRYSSNICFQALAWTTAVLVRTPSRSNRQAVTPSGKPSTPVLYPRGVGGYRHGRRRRSDGDGAAAGRRGGPVLPAGQVLVQVQLGQPRVVHAGGGGAGRAVDAGPGRPRRRRPRDPHRPRPAAVAGGRLSLG